MKAAKKAGTRVNNKSEMFALHVAVSVYVCACVRGYTTALTVIFNKSRPQAAATTVIDWASWSYSCVFSLSHRPFVVSCLHGTHAILHESADVGKCL